MKAQLHQQQEVEEIESSGFTIIMGPTPWEAGHSHSPELDIIISKVS
jgi:hypothetical protein